MKRLPARVWIGWLLILISICLLVWGFYPFEQKRRELRISPHDMQLPGIYEVLPNEICRA
ncbi:MAG: hypothetical protein Kow0088_02190 [Anaerolineales bacterium]